MGVGGHRDHLTAQRGAPLAAAPPMGAQASTASARAAAPPLGGWGRARATSSSAVSVALSRSSCTARSSAGRLRSVCTVAERFLSAATSSGAQSGSRFDKIPLSFHSINRVFAMHTGSRSQRCRKQPSALWALGTIALRLFPVSHRQQTQQLVRRGLVPRELR